jgi:Protein of unknown function (DUF2975)
LTFGPFHIDNRYEISIFDKEQTMNTLKANPVSSALTRPLGQKSLSSSLATALKFAQLVLAVMFAFTLVGAIFGITVAILVATKTVPLKVLNGSQLGNILATWTVAIPYLAYAVITTRAALLIVRRLQGVFASLVANQPFARDNAAHLRAIWVTLVVIEIARISAWVLMHGLTAAFAGAAHVTFPSVGEPIDLVRWFVIFVVLILAEVFRQGTQLREETELTV